MAGLLRYDRLVGVAGGEWMGGWVKGERSDALGVCHGRVGGIE